MESLLVHLVRSMNCYYSNLIKGHDTHPVDIERALKADFSHNPQQCDLQLEAQAHIELQAWIDAGNFDGRTATANGIVELHRRFCEKLPNALLLVRNEETGQALKIVPGHWRDRDIKIGRHVAISPAAIPRFMARGLARQEQAYKKHLANADLPRRNDLDGRGTLSEEALLYRGELARGDVQSLPGTSERTARRITSALLDRGVLNSSSTRAPLRLAFPATLAARWLPGLFPEK
jgi:Fic family protein